LRKFNVKIDSTGFLLTIKGKTVRTPVTILCSESDLNLVKMQLNNANVLYDIEETFSKNNDIAIETISLTKTEEDSIEKEEQKEINISELDIKYETLLSKMMKE